MIIGRCVLTPGTGKCKSGTVMELKFIDGVSRAFFFSWYYQWRGVHRAEQLPFTIWKRYNKTQLDPVALYGLEEAVLWGDIDRWDYSTDPNGSPPPYTEYTGLSLKHTFILFFILTGAQLLLSLFVKKLTSEEFCTKGNFLNKFLHLLLSLNLASPFEDWDQGKFSVQDYKERHKKTNREMACSLSVNIFFSFVMLFPLWYSGNQLHFGFVTTIWSIF